MLLFLSRWQSELWWDADVALRRLHCGCPEAHLKQPASLDKFLKSQLCPWTSHLLEASTLTVSQFVTKEAEGRVKRCCLLGASSQFCSTVLMLGKWNSKTVKAFPCHLIPKYLKLIDIFLEFSKLNTHSFFKPFIILGSRWFPFLAVFLGHSLVRYCLS